MAVSVSSSVQVRKPHAFKRRYEFWQNDQLVAVLEYEKRFSCDAVISIGDHKWKIKTAGFWKKSIELTAEQSPYTKTRIAYCWNFRLSFPAENNHTYNFKPIGFWKRSWAWYDENDNPVVEMKTNQFSRKNRGQITLHQPPSNNGYLLMMLGWYQLLAYEQHSAAVAASV